MKFKNSALQYAELFDDVIEIDDYHPQDFCTDIVVLCTGKYTNLIGEGAYAEVYKGNGPNVFKIGNAHDNKGYLSFLKFLRKEVDNPFLPVIGYSALVIDNASGDSWFLIEMERLIDAEDKKIYRMAKKFRVDLDAFLSEICYSFSRPRQKSFPKKFRRLMRKLERCSGGGMDMHRGNVMFRENGQIVLIDPIA